MCTAPVSGYVWAFMFVWPFVILLAEEARKAVVRSFRKP
jgi:hypothetical protein